jgi:hypothetical protein
MSQLLTNGLWLGGLVLGPIVGISFGVMAGFTRRQVVLRATPNQGIRRSVRRSFLLGLVALALTAASMIFVFPLWKRRVAHSPPSSTWRCASACRADSRLPWHTADTPACPTARCA